MMTDLAKELRRTRADMLGTDDEEHYWICHKAAEEIERLREWMDNNFTHCEPGVVPILGSVSKRIWYHATDDTESYPFSLVAKVALEQIDEG